MENKKYFNFSTAAVLLITAAALFAVVGIVLGLRVCIAHPFTATVYGGCALLMVAGFLWSGFRAAGRAQLWRTSMTLPLAVLFATLALLNGYLSPVLNLILVVLGSATALFTAAFCLGECLKKVRGSYWFWVLLGALWGGIASSQYILGGAELAGIAIPAPIFLALHLLLLVPVLIVAAIRLSKNRYGVASTVLFCIFVAITLAVVLFGGHLSVPQGIAVLCVTAVIGVCSTLATFEDVRENSYGYILTAALGVVAFVLLLGIFRVIALAVPKPFFVVIYAVLALLSLIGVCDGASNEEKGEFCLFFVPFAFFVGCILFGGYLSPLWATLIPAVAVAVTMVLLLVASEGIEKVLPWNILILVWAALVLNAGLMNGLFEFRLPKVGLVILYGICAALCFLASVPGGIILTAHYSDELGLDDGVAWVLCCSAVGCVACVTMILVGGFIPGWWNVIPGIVAVFCGLFFGLGGFCTALDECCTM